jgi:hypothetical protein
VQRYLQVKDFVPEPFWYIFLSLSRPSSSQGDIETEFKWRRGHLFDYDAAAVIYEHVISNPTARVTKVAEKNTKKWCVVVLFSSSNCSRFYCQETTTFDHRRIAKGWLEIFEARSQSRVGCMSRRFRRFLSLLKGVTDRRKTI